MTNTNISSSTQTGESRDDTLNAWDISYEHRFDNGLRQHLRLARSFRFPVLDEIWNYFDGTISLLDPQTGEHIEAGTSYTTASGTDFRLNLFHMRLTDEISYNGFTNVNLDPTRHDGADVSMRIDITNDWELKFNYSYREATFRSGTNKGNTIPEVPEQKFTLTNRYKLAENKTITLDASYTGKRYFGDDFGNIGKKMPAYALFNLKYNEKIENWDISLLINNLTDEHTADAGYYASWSPNPYMYYPLPDRAYYLTVNRSF